MTKTKLLIASSTDKGMERDHNEDFHGFIPDIKLEEWVFLSYREVSDLSEKGTLLIVADGMGGTNAGEVAAQLAVESIKNYFLKNSFDASETNDETVKSLMIYAIEYAQNIIVNHQKNHKETKGMGTTIVIGWILKNKVYIAWVGDSRAYLFNQNGLFQLSHDHSYVQELVDAGKITPEQAFYHPNSNIITQSLGDASRPPEPGFRIYNIQQNDVLLFCSDGLNSMIKDDEIQSIMQSEPNIDKLADLLIDAANRAGGYDNITVMLVKCLSVDSPLPSNLPNTNNNISGSINNDKIIKKLNEEYEEKIHKILIKNKRLTRIVYVLILLVFLIPIFMYIVNQPSFMKYFQSKSADTTTTTTNKQRVNQNYNDTANQHKQQNVSNGSTTSPLENIKSNNLQSDKNTAPHSDSNINYKKNEPYNIKSKNSSSEHEKQPSKTPSYHVDDQYKSITKALEGVLKSFNPPDMGQASKEFKTELENCIQLAKRAQLKFENIIELFKKKDKLKNYVVNGMENVKTETINLFGKDPELNTIRQ